MAKIVNVEWMQPTREFQCPCCSAIALNADGKVASQPCPHFLFNWDGDREDFGAYTDNVESLLDDSTLDVSGPVSKALLGSLSAEAVVFQITTRDEALGLIIRTDAIAFDPLAA